MRVSRPSLLRFFRLQSIYLSLAAVVAAIFWAIGQEINPLTILVYSICLGNLSKTAMDRATILYGDRSFPDNWLMFLLVLGVLVVPIYADLSDLIDPGLVDCSALRLWTTIFGRAGNFPS
jgi:hypothetical protein